MKKIEAVIFDWAGTTVDYGSLAPVQAFAEAFSRFGITPTDAEVREPMGMLKWNHIHAMLQMPRIAGLWQQVHGRAWTRQDVDAVYRESETALLRILKDFSAPKPYVLETVAALRAQGVKIGSTTGYTDEMMAVVTAEAASAGYAPDACFTPNAVGDKGRPYPYMVFRNLEALGVSSVDAAIKVGDTVADIREGKNAGLLSVGVVEGSSVMGLTQAEYDALSERERSAAAERVEAVYCQAGADYVIANLSELPDLIYDVERIAP